METVTRFAERQAGSASAVPTPAPEVARTLSVTANYLLSEDGRKASLLAGGDGRAVQQIPLQVPANRLHLVSVDKESVARLKLRPRFERESERGVVRIDASPIYDAPPTVDELSALAISASFLFSVVPFDSRHPSPIQIDTFWWLALKSSVSR